MYRLDASYLSSHGLNLVGTSLSNIHLMSRGVQLPFWVDGPLAGSFTSQNAIVFYGQHLHITNRPLWQGGDFTSTNIYWVYSDSSSSGLLMATSNAAPTNTYPIVGSFTAMVHSEVNNWYDPIDHFRPNGDNWFWGPVYRAPPGNASNPQSYTVLLPAATGSGATLTAVFADPTNNTHTMTAQLNGQNPASGGTSWTGFGLSTQTWIFAPGPNVGSNTVSFSLSSSGTYDYAFLDYFEVAYQRTFAADGNSLFFSAPNGDAQYSSSGYSSQPYILDLSASDPSTGLVLPVLLTGASFSNGTVTFQMPQNPAVTTRTVALSSAPLLPDSAALSSGVDLASPQQGCDLLIITHPFFHPTGQDQIWQEYLARREAQMSVRVVDIQDIYDNFSYGIFDPTAIHTFLQTVASNWDPVPKYVLLIGDATYDYYNYKQDPTIQNWVPTMMFDDLGDSTYMGRYPSDAWYADVNGDGYPDMAVGRLPARNYAQLAGMLTKIMAYEDQTLQGSWYKTGLFVADTWTQSWEQVFETFNTQLQATYMQSPWQTQHVYFHDPPYNGTDADACASDIRTDWPGSAIVHYDGHSGVGFYGKYCDIFGSIPLNVANCRTGSASDSDVSLLAPVTLPPSSPFAPLPFVLNAGCYSSAFDEPGDPCLMEALLDRPDGGDIGSTGFSTIAYPDEEETFNSSIFDLAFLTPKVRTLGDLVDAGRFSLPSTDARSVMGNILLGDPTLRLRLPAPAPPTQLSATPGDASAELAWSAPATTVASYNLYRSQDGGATWALVSGANLGASSTAYTDTGLTNGTTYSYYITTLDSEGFEGAPSNIASVTPGAPPCTLACTASVPTSAAVNQALAFSATATPSNCSSTTVTYDWGFGDGSPHSSSQNPTHTYTAAGTYTWTMTASLNGVLCSQTGSIAVGTCSLSCSASGPSNLMVNETAAFTAAATPSNCSSSTVTYDWGFGDGSAHSSDQNPTHAYTSAGTYTWTMTASDSGTTCSQTGTIQVDACSLTCSAIVPPSGVAGVPLTFVAASASECTASPTFLWDFGDGTGGTQGSIVTHAYAQGGTYQWTLTVTAGGQTCSQSGTVTVCSLTCSATVPSRGQPGAAVSLSATASLGAGCPGSPAFTWIFGDGTQASGASTTHAYASSGTYTWLLTASADGLTCSQEGSITVVDPPVITSVGKASPPFRLVLKGANLQAGAQVSINGTPWAQVSWKGTGKLVLKGRGLRAKFPGGTFVPIRVVNPDGGEVTVSYDRRSNSWRPAG
ncbi:MAG: C25 family cysteine peptidase [Acidobacteriota bacterium]